MLQLIKEWNKPTRDIKGHYELTPPIMRRKFLGILMSLVLRENVLPCLHLLSDENTFLKTSKKLRLDLNKDRLTRTKKQIGKFFGKKGLMAAD